MEFEENVVCSDCGSRVMRRTYPNKPDQLLCAYCGSTNTTKPGDTNEH